MVYYQIHTRGGVETNAQCTCKTHSQRPGETERERERARERERESERASADERERERGVSVSGVGQWSRHAAVDATLRTHSLSAVNFSLPDWNENNMQQHMMKRLKHASLTFIYI